MKLKKVFSLLLVAVFLLTSQSAFAATGIGDTKDQAISIFPNQEINLFLSDSTDKDWYKWTNTTGSAKKVTAHIWPPFDNQCFYRLGMMIDYNDGSTPTSIFYSEYGGPEFQSIYNVYIPDGATVFLVVDSVKFVLSQYSIQFYAY